ncbi:MAG: DUF378 domain-containing protein [Phycisphaerales bacterium]|nr:DUF378 domain-containing protein [Phycisphaerales bacterium]
MKTIDVLAAVLLVVGGLNWGLVGVANFDLVAALLGGGSFLAKVVYTLVGLSAVYQAASLRSIQQRWRVQTALA